MLDIGWSEMAMIAILALIVIGPKDLPRVMKTMGHWVRKARAVTREFQSSVDEMIREADLEDARKAVQGAKSMNPGKMIADTVDPTGTVTEEMRDIEREASKRDDDSAEPSIAGNSSGGGAEEIEAAADGEAEAPKATVIKTPAQVAPPHSLTPPKEDAAPAAADETAKPDAQQKSA